MTPSISDEEQEELLRLAGALNDEATAHRAATSSLVGGQRAREAAEADFKDGCATILLRLLARSALASPAHDSEDRIASAILSELIGEYGCSHESARRAARRVLSLLPVGVGGAEGWRPTEHDIWLAGNADKICEVLDMVLTWVNYADRETKNDRADRDRARLRDIRLMVERFCERVIAASPPPPVGALDGEGSNINGLSQGAVRSKGPTALDPETSETSGKEAKARARCNRLHGFCSLRQMETEPPTDLWFCTEQGCPNAIVAEPAR